MPQLRTFRDADLPPPLKWQALSFMRVEWPFIFSGDSRLSTDIYGADLRPVHFVVAEGEVLVSYATVIRMDLDHAGPTWRVYGLGNVLTYPSFRGEGHGRRVVDAATQYIGDSDADVAALFCDPGLAGLYAKSGWTAMEGATTLVGSKADPTPYGALRMMLFVSAKGRAGRPLFEGHPWYVGDPW